MTGIDLSTSKWCYCGKCTPRTNKMTDTTRECLDRGHEVAVQLREAFAIVLAPSVAISKAKAAPALVHACAHVSTLTAEKVSTLVDRMVSALEDSMPYIEDRAHCHWTVQYTAKDDTIRVRVLCEK